MNKIYKQYGEALRDVGLAEADLARKKTALNQIKSELGKNLSEGDGSVGIDISAHAFTNISDRLQRLAMENQVIYDDVFNKDEPSLSILWPNNLRAFVVTLLAEAYDKSAVVQKPSKNNHNRFEYHYNIKIEKWSGSDNSLIFTGVVEGGNLKTGFFNWE